MERTLNYTIKISICLLVLLLPLFFLPFSAEKFEFNKQYLLFFLVFLSFFAWLAKMILVDKEIRLRRSPLDIFVLIFLFIAILSTIFSVDKISSLFGFYGKFNDGLVSLISLVLLYFLITNNVAQKEEKFGGFKLQISGLLKVLLWSVFFVILFSYLSVFGIWQKLSNFQLIELPALMLQRTFSPVEENIGGLAVLLSVISVLLIGLILNSKNKSFFYWILLIASLGLLLIIDFNVAWLVLFISLLLFIGIALWKRLFQENVNKLLIPMLIMVLAGLFLFIESSNIQSLFQSESGIFQLPKKQVLEQSNSWQIGFRAATENVKSGFLGSGIGTFHYDFSKFKPVEFNQTRFWQIRFDRAGSHFAEILGTMGFLGFLSYLLLIGAFLIISWFLIDLSWKTEIRQQFRNYSLPLIFPPIALIVTQIFYYQNTVLSFTFWLILGLSVVSSRSLIGASKEKAISFKDFPELSLVFTALLIVLGLAILAMFFFALRFYSADVNYNEALKTNNIEKMEKATRLNIYQPQYKMMLSRMYLGNLAAELRKPVNERDQTVLSESTRLAITYAKGGEVGREYIKGATELAPGRVTSWETLGIVYRNIQGIALGSLEWGINSFQRAIELEPTNPVLHTELGKLYLISDDVQKAKEKFEKARELKPDYIDALIQTALIYERENNLEEAVRQMERIVNSYLDIEVSFQLGRLYFNNNQIDEAISQFQQVIIIMPNHSNAHYSLGVAYQKKGEIAKAIAEFRKVLELNPGNEDVQQKLRELGG